MDNKEKSIQEIQELTIRDYLLLLRIHAKKIILFGLIGLSISFYQMIYTPPSFSATATIVVGENPGASVIMDLRGNNERNKIENQLQLIRSRTVAKGAIEKLWLMKKNSLDLFGSNPFYPRGRRLRTYLKEIFSFGVYDDEKDKPIFHIEEYSNEIGERYSNKLISNLKINPRTNSDIIDVTYTSVWAEEAKLVINTIVDTFKEFDKILSGETASSSVTFLNKLLKEQEKALIFSEKELTLFKKQEKMYDLDGAAMAITSQIASIESEIHSKKSEITISQGKSKILQSKLSNDEINFAEKLVNTINAQVVSLRNEIGQLEGQLIQNVALYGQDHSAIKSINKKIDALKFQLNNKVSELTNQGIVAQDPLKSRQEIISELISLDTDITNYQLELSPIK